MRAGVPIVSLQQAIARLGVRAVADIALAACLGPKLFKAPAYARLIDRLWTESLATAVWSREIARSLRSNVEVSFLCGLLHQIGRPVVLQALQETLGPAAVAPVEADVLALLRTHGAAAGRVVARQWNLPEAVAETVAHVDDFRAAPRAPELVALVAAGRAFAAATFDAATPDAPALAGLSEMAEMAEINLYRSDIEVLLAEAEAVRATVEGMAL
jgi:HD-like signal output (HDOD) protein